MASPFRLTINNGPAAGEEFELAKPVVTMGRDISNDVVVNDLEVSALHARLTQTDDGYAIEDLNSTNGTLVNKARVLGHRPLISGDVIFLGTRVMLTYAGPAVAGVNSPLRSPTTLESQADSLTATGSSPATPGSASSGAAATGAAGGSDTEPSKHVLGARLKRVEDPRMLRGEAAFTADISLPNMLHMAILRSGHAHARISSIDTSAALKLPGVVRILTGADIEGKMMPLPCVWIPGGAESHFPSHPLGVPGAGPVLAQERVRYIGDPVAVVVAETRAQAFDALDAIHVDYHPLPVVIDPEEALKEGAPQLHAEVPKNLNAYIPYGDREGTERAISDAEVVITRNIRNQRTINSPIEPRSAIGEYDPATGEYTLRASTQSPHDHRLLLALMVLGVPFNKVRVIAPEIGGSFGTKGYLYADMPLVLYLARELGRPVKWVDTRRDLMRSTVQGRDQMMYATLAGSRDGKITALKCTSYANLGAYPSTIGPGVATAMVGRSMTSVYDIAHAFCDVYAVFTNLPSLGAQRGSGRAEATFLVERLIDEFAHEIGMDPAEVRRRNLVKPSQMPFDNRLGWRYDSGDYPAVLEKALRMANYADVPARRAEAGRRGKRLGVGMASFVAVSGVGPSPRMAKEGMLGGTWESANIKVHPTGEISVIIGSKPHGQSHETTFAQIVSEELGVPVAQIEILHSDTKRATFGQGSYGSRSFSVGGAAVLKAAREVKDKAILGAAHTLEARPEDIVYEDGRMFVAGSPDKALTLQEVALNWWYAWEIPAGSDPNLEVTAYFDPPDFNYPNGAHVAEVEVDEVTGDVDITHFVGVHDVGVMGNELVLEGQMHGGIVHGLGQALFEEARYSAEGQLLTSSLTEYALPRATHVGDFDLGFIVTPTPHSGLGAKGAGEMGTVGSAAAVANAVCDALSDLGIRHIEMPLTPERVWRAIRDARAAQGTHA